MIEEQSVIIDRAAALGPMDAHVIRMGSPSPDSLSSSSQSQSSHPSSPVSDESITIFDVLSKEIKHNDDTNVDELEAQSENESHSDVDHAEYLQPHSHITPENYESEVTYEPHSSRVGDRYQSGCPSLISSTLDYAKSRSMRKRNISYIVADYLQVASSECLWSPDILENSSVEAFLIQVENLFPFPHQVSLEKTLYLLRLYNYDIQSVLNEIRPAKSPYPFTLKMEPSRNNLHNYAVDADIESKKRMSSLDDVVDFDNLSLSTPPTKKKAKKLTEDAKFANLESEFSPTNFNMLCSASTGSCFVCRAGKAYLTCCDETCGISYHPQCIGIYPLISQGILNAPQSWKCPAHSCKKCGQSENLRRCLGCGYGFCADHKVKCSLESPVCICEECLVRITTSEEVFTSFVETMQRGLNKPVEKIPCLGKKPLQLLQVFKSTVRNGGGVRVTALKLWKQIGRDLDLPSTITNASSMLRKHYVRLLLPIEQLTTQFQVQRTTFSLE